MKSLHVFVGVDMRMGHLGLKKYASLHGVDLNNLPGLSAAIFISKDKMRIKSYSYNGVVSYLVQYDNKRPLDLDMINELPRAFSANGSFDYSKALRASLEKKLKLVKLEEARL